MPADDANSKGTTPRPATGLDESVPRFVTTREGRVAWHEAGAATEGTIPLVLLHGFTGHRDDFIGVLPELGRVRRVLAPDLRGHGDSDPAPGRKGWGFDQLVADLLAFLDALEIERIDLLGHSVGGFVALRFAMAHPERVRSLIFLCSAPETPAVMNAAGFEKAASIAAERGMAGLQVPAEKATRRNPGPELEEWSPAERYYAHHRRRIVSMTPASYRGIGKAFFESASLVSRLSEVSQPSLVLVGDLDQEFFGGADLFEAGLPDVRRVTLRGAGHHPHQERREAFLAEVEAHLARVDAASAARGPEA